MIRAGTSLGSGHTWLLRSCVANSLGGLVGEDGDHGPRGENERLEESSGALEVCDIVNAGEGGAHREHWAEGGKPRGL